MNILLKKLNPKRLETKMNKSPFALKIYFDHLFYLDFPYIYNLFLFIFTQRIQVHLNVQIIDLINTPTANIKIIANITRIIRHISLA
jgi:hypothetical protein